MENCKTEEFCGVWIDSKGLASVPSLWWNQRKAIIFAFRNRSVGTDAVIKNTKHMHLIFLFINYIESVMINSITPNANSE